MTALLRCGIRLLPVVAATVLILLLAGAGPARNGPERVDVFTCTLAGTQADPPNASLAVGRGELSIRNGRLRVRLEWENLSGPVAGAHLHDTAIVGGYAPIAFDLVPGTFPEGAASPIEAEFPIDHLQRDRMRAGLFHADLHTATYPAGEIRGRIIRRADG